MKYRHLTIVQRNSKALHISGFKNDSKVKLVLLNITVSTKTEHVAL